MKRPFTWILGGIASMVLLAPGAAAPAVNSSAAALRPFVRNIAASIERSPDASSLEAQLAAVERVSKTLPSSEGDAFPGRTYGNLTSDKCFEALDDRGITYERYGRARGVETPVRLMGPLHGIPFHHQEVDWLTSARREVLDC